MSGIDLPDKMLALGTARSVIRETFEYANMRKAQIGAENVFDFSLGNPSTPPPPQVKAAIADLVENTDSISLHGYTSSPGGMYAREAAARLESRRAGYEIPASNIYMTCGAAASLAVLLKAVVCEGDRVALLAPFFPEYKVFAENAGAKAVIIPPEKGRMTPDLDALEKQLESGIKAVIINSPNNPSGAVFSAEEIKKISAVLYKYEKKTGKTVLLISDEPYRELVYDGKEVPYIPAIYKDTVICYSFSKSLSLPGERIGYIAVPPCVSGSEDIFYAVCGAGRSLGYVCAPTMFQRVIANCIDAGPDIPAYDRNRKAIYTALSEMGFDCIYPSGAFYLFIKVPKGFTAAGFCEAARAHELLLVPSDTFGVEGYVRLSYCVSPETIQNSLPAFKRLAQETLKK